MNSEVEVLRDVEARRDVEAVEAVHLPVSVGGRTSWNPPGNTESAAADRDDDAIQSAT